MGNKIDMVGQKFSHLTVVEASGKDNRGEILWRCICDCGNESKVLGSNLRNGHTKTCGCRMDFGHKLAGQHFGKLFVIHKVTGRDKQKRRNTESQWLCQCECGRKK